MPSKIALKCGIDIPPCHERGISDDDCYQWCPHRKENKMYKHTDYAPNHVNGCGCYECTLLSEYKQAVADAVDWKNRYDIAVAEMQTKERTRAATCRCGHVGAECFNDSCCQPEPRIVSPEHKCTCNGDSCIRHGFGDASVYYKSWNQANAMIEYWRNAFHEQSSAGTQAEILLQNRITECDGLVGSLLSEISDLQADYARDTQAWQNVYNANEEANDKVYQEQTDRIEALETTIRVLTGMID